MTQKGGAQMPDSKQKDNLKVKNPTPDNKGKDRIDSNLDVGSSATNKK
jgi:hypothetical protein